MLTRLESGAVKELKIHLHLDVKPELLVGWRIVAW